jgi:RND family efflux transporter MFP subunit
MQVDATGFQEPHLTVPERKGIHRRLLYGTAMLTLVGLANTVGADLPGPSAERFSVVREIGRETLEYVGTVVSHTRVNIVAQVAGRVRAVHVRAGQRVRKGDLLLELASDEFQAKLQAANARLAIAQADLERAQGEYRRVEQLAQKGLASSHDRDSSTADWKQALAVMDGARAAVAEAETQLGFTRLTSPISGVVATTRINPGEFAMPAPASATMAASGAVLMTLYDPDALWIEARIPERFAARIQIGTPATVRIDALDSNLQGQFSEVAAIVDDTTRAFAARIDLPADPGLKLGMLGRVRFAAAQRPVIRIPHSALKRRGQLDTVFVDANGTAELRLIRTGSADADRVEVLSGLSEGERVVLHPAERLRDGDRL